MAWTSPKTWVAAAKLPAAELNTHLRDNLNFLASPTADTLDEVANGFSNASYADLDALTTASFSRGVSVTVTTDTSALVLMSSSNIRQISSGVVHLGCRVSGATTIAADDDQSANNESTERIASTYLWYVTTLTAGSNTFELQARASTGTGLIRGPSIYVIPLP